MKSLTGFLCGICSMNLLKRKRSERPPRVPQVAPLPAWVAPPLLLKSKTQKKKKQKNRQPWDHSPPFSHSGQQPAGASGRRTLRSIDLVFSPCPEDDGGDPTLISLKVSGRLEINLQSYRGIDNPTDEVGKNESDTEKNTAQCIDERDCVSHLCALARSCPSSQIFKSRWVLIAAIPSSACAIHTSK